MKLKIQYPKLPELPWPITKTALKKRKEFLQSASDELHRIEKRITVEKKHLHDICPQHQHVSGSDGDGPCVFCGLGGSKF